MGMNKKKDRLDTRRIAGIIVSVVLLLALLMLFTDPWSILRREGDRIVLRNAAAVDGISVLGGADSVSLTRKGDSWYLGDGTRVSPKSVENLLFAASRLTISSSVPAALLPAYAGQRQVIFREGNRVLLSYNFVPVDGRYLVRPDGSDLAHDVTLPGYAGLQLDRVFSDRAGHYLEKVLIDLMPSEIALIRVERSGSEPFALRQDTLGGITCTLDGTRIPDHLLDTLSIRLLFSYFTSIRYEHRSGIPVDSLLEQQAAEMMASLTVRSHHGEEHTLRIFPFREKPGEEPHMFRALVAFDDEPGALVVNFIYLDVLMRDPSHYFGSGE